MTRNHGRTGRPKGRPPTTKAQNSAPETATGRTTPEDIPTPPDHLDEDGLLFWVKVWGMPHVTEADFFAVKHGAEIYQEGEMLRRLLTVGGAKRSVVHPNKTSGPSVVLRDLRENRREFNAALAALGLTPADRARIAVDNDGAAAAIAAVLKESQDRRDRLRAEREQARKDTP